MKARKKSKRLERRIASWETRTGAQNEDANGLKAHKPGSQNHKK